MAGFKATATMLISGRKTKDKCRKTAKAILDRCSNIFKELGIKDFRSVHVQVYGAEDSYGPHAR